MVVGFQRPSRGAVHLDHHSRFREGDLLLPGRETEIPKAFVIVEVNHIIGLLDRTQMAEQPIRTALVVAGNPDKLLDVRPEQANAPILKIARHEGVNRRPQVDRHMSNVDLMTCFRQRQG